MCHFFADLNHLEAETMLRFHNIAKEGLLYFITFLYVITMPWFYFNVLYVNGVYTRSFLSLGFWVVIFPIWVGYCYLGKCLFFMKRSGPSPPIFFLITVVICLC